MRATRTLALIFGMGLVIALGWPAAGVTGAQPGGGSNNPNFWSLSGNNGTDATEDFIGTTDATDWVIRTAATERMRVTQAGNIGIGTSSPDARLSISAELPADAFRVRSNGNTSFIIDQDGQTGIGASQPAAQLHVNSAAAEDALLVRTHGSLTPRLLVDASGNVGISTGDLSDRFTVLNNGTGRAGAFRIDNSANNTAALSTVTNGGGSALFANILNPQSTNPTLHAIHTGDREAGRFEGQLSVRRNNHQIEIQDTNNSSKTWNITSHQSSSGIGFWEDGQTGRFLIEAGGNVGIGTTNPQARLHIDGNAGTDILVTDGEFARMRMVANNPADDVILSVQARGSNTPNRAEIGTVSNHDLALFANGAVRLVVRNDGSVCIGSC